MEKLKYLEGRIGFWMAINDVDCGVIREYEEVVDLVCDGERMRIGAYWDHWNSRGDFSHERELIEEAVEAERARGFFKAKVLNSEEDSEILGYKTARVAI